MGNNGCLMPSSTDADIVTGGKDQFEVPGTFFFAACVFPNVRGFQTPCMYIK